MSINKNNMKEDTPTSFPDDDNNSACFSSDAENEFQKHKASTSSTSSKSTPSTQKQQKPKTPDSLVVSYGPSEHTFPSFHIDSSLLYTHLPDFSTVLYHIFVVMM